MAPDTNTSFEVGGFVAYRDTDDPDDEGSKHYHIGRVNNVADGQAQVHCYATQGKALSRAQWKPLYQNDRGVYAIGKRTHGEPVVDNIPVDEGTWMLHYNVQFGENNRLTKQVRRQLTDLKVKHHRLNHTFP